MSLELYVFIAEENLPNCSEWQTAIDDLGLPVRLDRTLNLAVDSGFSPCQLPSVDSGFEIAVSDAREVVETYPDIGQMVAGRNKVISFSWAGDLAECACVLAAAAGLVRKADGIAYYASDALTYDLEGLVAEARQCLAEIK